MSKNAGTSSRHKPKSSSAEAGARDLAALVLMRVWSDAAWAAPVLDAELRRRGGLDPRDARLATELVYGVLRTTPYLLERLSRHASQDKWRQQPLVQAHMCIAAYCILFLDRVPNFAAVSEAVDAIKQSRDRRVAGFVNAVLRKLTAEPHEFGLAEAVTRSLPAWLRDSMTEAIGPAALLAQAPTRLELALAAGEDRDQWLAQLREARPEASFEAGELSPRCIVVRGSGDQRQLPGSGAAWRVQEQGAQLLGLMVGAQPGEAVLDACAGRGGKAVLLLDQVGADGSVDVADLHPRKLAQLGDTAWGGAIRSSFAVDWTRGTGDVTGPYDRVLVDAPCTGTGTLRRRPEIAQRLTPADVERLAALQIAITERVAPLVVEGGRLFFAVCSVLRQEAEAVVEALVKRPELGLVPAPFDSPLARSFAGDDTSLRLTGQTDGYFMASFVVRRT
jgi:16S rRNA (cytosine967-C5)-methyltransferase